jgi:putative oxidoreductase
MRPLEIRESTLQSLTVGAAAYALALIFLGAGAVKLGGLGMHTEHFARWGYPGWFVYVVGGAEVLLAVLVAHPGTRFTGAMGLLTIMAGAFATHWIGAEYDLAQIPLLYGTLASLTALAACPPHRVAPPVPRTVLAEVDP